MPQFYLAAAEKGPGKERRGQVLCGAINSRHTHTVLTDTSGYESSKTVCSLPATRIHGLGKTISTDHRRRVVGAAVQPHDLHTGLAGRRHIPCCAVCGSKTANDGDRQHDTDDALVHGSTLFQMSRHSSDNACFADVRKFDRIWPDVTQPPRTFL